MKAGTSIRTMSVIAVLAFALLMLGCASPQKQERAGGGVHGEDSARHTQQAKPVSEWHRYPIPAFGRRLQLRLL